MTKHPSIILAIAALIGVNALWGTSFPIMKALNEVVSINITPGQDFSSWSVSQQFTSSALMIGLRFALATIMLAALLPKLFWQAARTEWLAGMWIGLAFCVGLILQVIGLASIPASRSGFLTSLTAVYTPLLASILFRTPPSRNVWIGIGLALLGVLVLSEVISIHSTSNSLISSAQISSVAAPFNWGDIWTTLGSLFFSVQVLLVDYYGKKLRSAYFTPGMFITSVCVAWCAFGIGCILISRGLVEGAVPPHSWWMLCKAPAFSLMILFLAFFCSLLSFLGMNTYQPYVSASQASVIYSTEPLFASVWAMFLPSLIGAWAGLQYLNEQLTNELIVGGILISIANVIALWPTTTRPKLNSDSSEVPS